MPKDSFQFKQFTIFHDRCAMKVGTDGVLLGAWCPISDNDLVLEVGAGSGLVSLMLAQRSKASILGVEIDIEAASQAKGNIEKSPWSGQIGLIEADFLEYNSVQKFDLLVSNPPFFDDSLLSPSTSRSLARHTHSLSYDNLMVKAAQLLSDRGRICLIIPYDKGAKLDQLAEKNGLYKTKCVAVIPKPEALPKRLLIEYSKVESSLSITKLLIEIDRHQYSDDYIALTKDFYLKM